MMNKIYKGFFLFYFLFVADFSTLAQKVFFSDVSEGSIQTDDAKRVIVPQKFRTVILQNASLKSFLWSLPKEAEVTANIMLAPLLELPMPDGRTAKFRVWESSIQDPALETKFPEIKTFVGQGIDDPLATIRFDYTPLGFHAQVLTINGSYYIDPYAVGLVNHYMSYYRTDLLKTRNFTCGVQGTAPILAGRFNNVQSANCLGTDLRTYRLAVASTGEYAQAPGIAAGTNATNLHAAIVSTVNRVVGVFEKEISIRLMLVANNNQVEFLNADTDPFNGNNDPNTLINESQTVINTNIGVANYDIGHTFSTGGGGLAALGSVCGANKANGVTGTSSPTGDAYDIDYVAHEVGHQFGANHTFNSIASNCGGGNINESTAYEVGSGTTIMAYAGICGSDNTQPNSDPYFHAISFDEISNFVSSGGGASCAILTPTGNTLPVIAAFSTATISIPVETPFILTGSATDINGDALTYSWEEWDLGPAGAWNSGKTSTTAPLFKSRIPKPTGSRTFPDISVIVAGYPVSPPANMNGLKGETLPSVERAMKFKLTVRDNRAGGGGVVSSGSGGCQSAINYQVNTVGTTAFTVAIPNGGESWEGSTSRSFTWNVVGTNVAPFNVANVKISLSTDGGFTYPVVLAASTANDGTEMLVIPNIVTNTARVKVEAIGNIFFDISNANFTITAATASFSFNNIPATTLACAGPSTAVVNLGTSATGGFVTPIILTASGVPAGNTVTFSPNPITPGTTTTVTLNNTQNLAAGTYTITVTGVAGAETKNTILTYNVAAGAAPTIATQPLNVTICEGSNAIFTVTTAGAMATSYQWQLSTDGGAVFNNITGATAASYTVTAVTAVQTNYRYRVFVNGQCAGVTSAGAILIVQTVPIITAQPQNATECVGNNAVFSVTATGNSLTYQWQVSVNASAFTNVVNAAPYRGATTSTLTLGNTAIGFSGYKYRVIVTGVPCGSVTSNTVTLTINPLPSSVLISSQFYSLTPYVNTILFTSVMPAGNYSYQWFKDGIPIAGAASSSLPVNIDGVGDYTVSVTDVNGCKATSARVTITDSVSNMVFVYPNPSRGRFQVRYYNANNTTTAYTVIMYDFKGARVYRKQFPITQTYTRMDVDLTNVLGGMYMLEVRDANGKRLASSSVIVK